MKTTKIFAVYKKEMLDLLRDKKTLIMMVLVPLVLYPLIFIGAILISSSISNKLQTDTYRIVLTESSEHVADFAYDREDLIAFLENAEDELEYHLEVIECEDPKAALAAEDISAWIQVDVKDSKLDYTVTYLSSVTNSSTASDMVYDKLKNYSMLSEERLLTQAGLDAGAYMNPFTISWSDQSSKEESIGSILGSILPFLLITSILMGAVYPSIDTTSGEKERGTLETLLTLPLRNDELIMGKFLAVSTVAIVSALLNLISMGFMATFFYSMLESSSADFSVNLSGFAPALIIVVLCIIAFALFISAITMCVTSFAKSFKEANNYVTPLLLVVMLTGYIGFIPNIEFNALMASIPVVNICLLITNILLFKFNLSLILIVLVTNIAYAVLAIWALSKIYDSEGILFDEGGINLQLFTSRKDLRQGGVPNFSDAALVMAVGMLLLLYLGSLFQLKFGLYGLLLTQLLILLVPVFAAWYTKKDIRATFHIAFPKLSHVLGAIFLLVGVYCTSLLISVPLTNIWSEDAESINMAFDSILEGKPFILAFAIIAIAPAICEEALFRGYLFSAAQKKFRPVTAILLVAALFGIYHLSFIKFFTTGILGAALCYAVYKSGSIVTSFLMHLINNGFSVVLMYCGARISNVLPFLTNEQTTTSDILLLAAAAILGSSIGVILLRHGSRDTNLV